MSTAKLLILIAVFFFTSVLSVVTGSTSLITVPVMIGLGIEAHVAAINRKTLKNRNHGEYKHGGKPDSQHDSKGNGMASAKGLAKVVSDTKTLPSNAAMTLCRLICRQQGTKPLNNEALKLEAAVHDYRLADYSNAIEWASDHDFWKDWLTVDYVAKKYAKLMADYVKDGGHISDVLSAEAEEWYGDQ